MALDDEVREFLATKPDAGEPTESVAARRAAILQASDELFLRFARPEAPVASETEHRVPVPGGSIRVKVFRPAASELLPVHVFLHGGGFWLGSVDELVVQSTCRARARGAGCVVVAADYRLAPEHRFPTAVEDCLAALEWAHTHAHGFGGDADALSVGGVSAGATLAAATALAARDRGGPPLRLQLLEVPPLDLSLATMRGSGVGDDYGMTLAEMQLSVDLYLASPDLVREAYVSPLLASDVSGLPATHVMTAELDPLRDDGARFVERLRAAGVPATITDHAGAVHGAILLTGTWPQARDWEAEVISTLRRVRPALPHPAADAAARDDAQPSHAAAPAEALPLPGFRNQGGE